MADAFKNRFGNGLVIGAARLPIPAWVSGIFFGVLLSLPDAIITNAFIPIPILCAVGAIFISLIVEK